MKKEPFVSVVIPTYNRAHLIGETLDSVLAQTYQNWECIVVDDGSSDNTDEVVCEYLKKDSRFEYYKRPDEHLPGGNGARNYGFKMSQGDYIQWFDSDDLMLPNLLCSQLNKSKESNCNFVICLSKIYNDKFNEVILNRKNIKITSSLYNDFVSKKINVSLLTFFVTRESVQGYSFNEKLKKSQEYDFFSNFFLTNNSYAINSVHLVKVRSHLGNISSSFQKDKYKIDSFLVARENILIKMPFEINLKVKNKVQKDYLRGLRILLLNNYLLFYYKNCFSSLKSLSPLKIKILKYIFFGTLFALTGRFYKYLPK